MRVRKADDNQPEIVKAFRSAGCSVAHTHTIGKGFPDIAVGVSGLNILVEIKDGNKPVSARSLTPDEKRWHDNWLGNVYVVETPEQAVELVNRIRSAGL